MTTAAEREKFDSILERWIGALPLGVRELLDETPIIVEDEPSRAILEEMNIDARPGQADLCGLHSGVPLDERTLLGGDTDPGRIYLFRGPILRLANWEPEQIERQIQITLLHELGHHFGLDEEELKALGYD